MTSELLVLAGLAASTPPALVATGGNGVAVRAPTCGTDAFSFPAFVDFLRVEMAGTGLSCCDVVEPARWPPAPPAVRVDVSADPCEAQLTVVWLRVDDPARRQGAHRGVTITDLAVAARSRVLALVAAELVRSTEHDADGERQSPATLASARVRGKPHPQDLGGGGVPVLHGGAELRSHPIGALVLWGVRMGFSVRVGSHMSIAGDVGVLSGDRSYDIGTVSLRAATSSLSVGPRWSSGDFVTITTVARGEIGWAELQGASFDSTLIRSAARSALVASGGAGVALEVPSRSRLRARVFAQGGAMVRGLVADVGGKPGAGMSGPFWSMGLSLTLAPWR